MACEQAADAPRDVDLVAWVRAAIGEAVELYMEGDVPIGALLSGGVDSSLVTALMAREGRRVPTFSMGFGMPGRDETGFAAIVAESLGTEHHAVRIGADILPGLPARIVEMYDEPFADGSAVPTWKVAAAARERVTVALSGDGGDEVFGGYNRYWGWLRTFGPAPAARTWRQLLGQWLRASADRPRADPLVGYAQLMELFSPEEKRASLSPDWAREFDGYDDYWNYRQHWRPELEPGTRLQYLDLKTYLPDDILTKVDRASMAVSLEVRPPLLDHVLVERLLSLPADVRTPNAQGKFLLKQAAQGLVPEAILRRPKQGFSAPWTTWMQANQEWAARSLEPSGSSTSLFRANLAGDPALPRYGEKAWAAMLAECWMRSRA